MPICRALATGLVAVACCLFVSATAQDQTDVPPGLTDPVVLKPFVPHKDLCAVPSGLNPSLVFVQDNRREFMEGVGTGLARAALDRGLSYDNLVADDDAQRMIDDAARLLQDGGGAIVVAPVNPRSLAPTLQALIARGVYVGAVVPPPAVTILNAPQYLTGKILADEAATYIDEKLDGHANVVLLTHDSLQFLAPRFTAMRDVLGKLPDVRIVADISPAVVNEDGGYQTMKTILLAQPNVDVVLGADTVVLGAMRALSEAGKLRADQFLGGIDGEPDAIAAIEHVDSAYKATVSLASPVFGYALGQFAADWLEGKYVPQAMDVLPTLLTPLNLDQYRADLAAPDLVWADPARRNSYLRMYGSICYDTRESYLNFSWSSEDAAD
ncbi:D-ribose transporter subunit RbsB [Devosia equisanguinis]|uniref:D-ribose transporter subunit RbsB n=1 Tax=Devosia equisanguinis TaxID=2490941 RepID=A0A447I810_9HYPH|nr:sugar ABC transporter substrate-binding protein [Devosia equisanguinis]VDS03626.1 D-ribose transporter subunit RbsB [Devosia equisanguinis]